MPEYSDKSRNKLRTAHHDLMKIFYEVVKGFDNTILYGHRSPELQFELYRKGRKYKNGVWTIEDLKAVVTYRDGFEKLSDHNHSPSLAVDAIPYPINWSDGNKHIEFGGYVLGVVDMLLRSGEIGHKIGWGGYWKKPYDPFHFYIINQ